AVDRMKHAIRPTFPGRRGLLRRCLVMGVREGVTVALPIFRPDPERLRAALGSIASQTLKDIEILLVPNGADSQILLLVRDLARQDSRARVITLGKPGLAAALNAAIEKARF